MRLVEWINQHPRYKKWLNRRLPRCREVTLTQRQIFIFLSKEGLLFAVLLLVTFLAGVNYGNNLILAVCFFLSSIMLIAIYHSYTQLSGLKIKVLGAEDAEAGGIATYTLELMPTTAKQYAQLELIWDEQYQRIALLDQRRVLSFNLLTEKRGQFLPPRLLLKSVYPLGLIRAWTYVYFDQVAWVSPRPVSSTLRQASHALENDSQFIAVRGQEDFDELKKYIPGESLSRVSWSHLAKGQGLLSKQFVEFRSEQNLLDYDQMPATEHEMKLSQLAYWVHELTRRHSAFALRLPTQVLDMGQGEPHMKHALRLLAEEP